MSNKVLHFDIFADDPKRAERFYSEALGWKFEKWDGPMEYWMITAGSESEKGINGGMSKREGEWAKKGASIGAVTIGTDDLDVALEKIKNAGGKVVMEKAAIAGVGWMANFKDPEGNVLGIMQEDPDAK
jgi:predicted enzyme related to lactoylglutathione lyase